MKKIIKVVLVSIVMSLIMIFSVGCIENSPDNTITAGDRFVILKERTTANTVYVEMYDKNTKVMYVYIKLAYSGSLTMLVDSDGSPLLYQG